MNEHSQPTGQDRGHRRRACLPPLAVLAAALTLAAIGSSRAPTPAMLTPLPVATAQPELRVAVAPIPDDEALDPWRGTIGARPSLWAWIPEAPSSADEATQPVAEAPAPVTTPAPVEAAPPRTAMTVPLPMRRPPELRSVPMPRRIVRAPLRREAAAPAPVAEDNRSFFEKLFGVETSPARAYTALESRPIEPAPRPRLSPPLVAPSGEGGTAVYDISARSVTLPNGERLEAHSGLGEIMDDPRHVHVRMRGATPPGTYALTEREQLFHGVRALRLTPVGGADAVHGRVGLLAHTFMLGPTGASNGCVSFRDYQRFLDAYLRGEIRQLMVVAGARDATPSFADAALHLARN